jgi:uncharacterized protein involved in response to NO
MTDRQADALYELQNEPYRLFFPIGWLFGLWGAVLWPAFVMGLTSTYPGPLHAQVMVGGFLSAFAFGFLMTAVPRFTRSLPARVSELAWIALPLVALPLVGLSGSSMAISLTLLLSFTGAVKFLVKRFRQRNSEPPQPFMFIGIGICSGLLGLVLQLFGEQSAFAFNLGRLLFLQAFMLALVVGVGSRLIPMFMGFGPPPSPEAIADDKPRSFHNPFIWMGIVFLLSYVIEAADGLSTGRLARALLVTGVMVNYWFIWKLPPMRTKLTWGLWLSAWMTLAGLWGVALFPSYNIHFLHLVYAGGLGLMTLMIATRVVLAHGGFSLQLEGQLKSLFVVIGFVLFAAVTRLSAGFIPKSYLPHLAYAAWLWIGGLLIWGAVIGRRIFQRP